jgi:hypothetical protein
MHCIVATIIMRNMTTADIYEENFWKGLRLLSITITPNKEEIFYITC